MDRRTLDAAYRYATLILGDPADAEDATHDAALSAWRHFGDLRDTDRFDAWFGRILVNACRDRLRRGRRMSLHEIDLTPAAPGGGPSRDVTFELADRRPAADPAEAVARREAIAAGLRSLSVEHREALVLRYWGDLTVDEIAARTGASAGTVKSRIHYALRNLRASLRADEHGRYER